MIKNSFFELVAGWMIAVVAILQIPGWGLWTIYKNKKAKTSNYVTLFL